MTSRKFLYLQKRSLFKAVCYSIKKLCRSRSTVEEEFKFIFGANFSPWKNEKNGKHETVSLKLTLERTIYNTSGSWLW